MPKKESRLVVRLFGAPRVTLDDAPIETARRKTLALLVYLACNSNQRLTRESLAALFWAEQSQERAFAIGALKNQAQVKSAPEPDYRIDVDEVLKTVDARTRGRLSSQSRVRMFRPTTRFGRSRPKRTDSSISSSRPAS